MTTPKRGSKTQYKNWLLRAAPSDPGKEEKSDGKARSEQTRGNANLEQADPSPTGAGF